MTPLARSLLAAIVALSCVTHSDRVEAETPTVPPGWTVISPPVTEEGWLCANWARQQWSVEVAESGGGAYRPGDRTRRSHYPANAGRAPHRHESRRIRGRAGMGAGGFITARTYLAG